MARGSSDSFRASWISHLRRFDLRVHGTLIKWNADRGFGFIALTQTRDKIFVHILVFPRDGVRPRIGETISFEVNAAPDGRKRAVDAKRPSVGTAVNRTPSRSSGFGKRSSFEYALPSVALLVVVMIAVVVATSRKNAHDPMPQEPLIDPVEDSLSEEFDCDGRTRCPKMHSCAEAKYFLDHCPGVEMDGDGDGIPYESQHCN